MGDVARPSRALGSDELLGPGVVEGTGLHGGAALQLLEGGGWGKRRRGRSRWRCFLKQMEGWRRDFLDVLRLLLPDGCLLLLQQNLVLQLLQLGRVPERKRRRRLSQSSFL